MQAEASDCTQRDRSLGITAAFLLVPVGNCWWSDRTAVLVTVPRQHRVFSVILDVFYLQFLVASFQQRRRTSLASLLLHISNSQKKKNKKNMLASIKATDKTLDWTIWKRFSILIPNCSSFTYEKKKKKTTRISLLKSRTRVPPETRSLCTWFFCCIHFRKLSLTPYTLSP